MTINNSIKAIILQGTKLLVADMKTEDGKEYYTLPGGKQEPDELMLDALRREVAEETGYEVEPKSLMFVCDIIGEADKSKLEYDFHQIGTKWLSIDNIIHEELYPVEMRNVIKQYYLGKPNDIYLGEMK